MSRLEQSNNPTEGPSRIRRHFSVATHYTNLSSIAGSLISNGETLRLSQFPEPPNSIPTTPIWSDSGTPSPTQNTFTVPLIPKRKKGYANLISGPSTPVTPCDPSRTTASTYSKSSSLSTQATVTHSQAGVYSSVSAPSSHHALSPHDWHDGVSSVDVDTAEARLLSTSFITSPLRQNPGPRVTCRESFVSDALSDISGSTYPVAASNRSDEHSQSSHHPSLISPPLHRPHGAPVLLGSSFMPIPELSSQISGDSTTLYSNFDYHPSLMKTADPTVESYAGVVSAINRSRVGHSPESSSGHHESAHLATLQEPHFSLPSSPPFASTTGLPQLRDPKASTQTPCTRESTYSAKSVVPSIISRISSSGRAIRHVFTQGRVKSLPPVPLIPRVVVNTETSPENSPITEVTNPAGVLQKSLEKDYYSYKDLDSHDVPPQGAGLGVGIDDSDTIARNNAPESLQSNRARQSMRSIFYQWPILQEHPEKTQNPPVRESKRIFLIFGIFLVIGLAAAGAAIGITIRRKSNQLPACSNHMIGALCELNSTCVCTSQSGECGPLAQSLLPLVPNLSTTFAANMTSNAVYKSMWRIQGSVVGNNCASQSLLFDVAPALDMNNHPNRTQWAQTALLWNLIQSQDLEAVENLRKFVLDAPWTTLAKSDGPSIDGSSTFSKYMSGFVFDFAAQTITEPNVTFVAVGQPTNAQISQVESVALSALDRMYSFANASSTQHEKALARYWTTVLQLNESLSEFLTAFSTSPILLPFDATSSYQSQSFADLFTTTSSLPPPLGCYPGLTAWQVQQINAIEGGVFGLPPLTNQTQFDPKCYPNRPMYGVLDVLRLRLPFLDYKTSAPRQAVVLQPDVSPRAVIYSGGILSPLPGPSNITTAQSDPRQYGTLSRFNHIILNYLSSMDPSVAIELVKFVLNSPQTIPVPPANSTFLYQSLSSVPPIEVAVFGSINASDIDHVVSSFTTSDSLFFGSEQGMALRRWAITGAGRTVVWSDSALSSQVVRDNSFADLIFNQTWTAAWTALRAGIGTTHLVTNITEAFRVNGRLSAS